MSACLERIAASGLIEQGLVNTIELDAIRRGLGEKWPRRREQVWSHVEKTMEASLPDTSFYARLNDTSYIICLPGLSSGAAQTRSARLLRDVLIFFLGSSTHADIIVRSVSYLDGERIESAPIALGADLVPERAPKDEEKPRSPQPELVLGQAKRPIIASLGGPISVGFEVEDLFCLAKSARIARRLKAEIFEQQRAASPRRLESLETAALAAIDGEAMQIAQTLLDDPHAKELGLIVPVHIQTCANAQGRQNLIGALDASANAKRRVLIELVGIGAGTPYAALSEAIALLRPRTRGVFARLSMPRERIKNLQGLPLTGLIVDTSLWRNFEVALAEGIIAYSEVAKNIAPALVAGPLPSAVFADVCEVAGVTHFTLQGKRAELSAPSAPPCTKTRLVPETIYQLLFVSRVSKEAKDFAEVLERQRAPNIKAQLTSFALLHGGYVLQVIEGPRAGVSAAMRAAFEDPLRSEVACIQLASKAEREFPRWSMATFALEKAGAPWLGEAGLKEGQSLSELSSEAALYLLQAAAKAKQAEEERDAAR